jgi:hypothetical protein
MGVFSKKFKLRQNSKRKPKRQTLIVQKLKIQSAGEVKPFQIRLPPNATKLKCMLVFGQDPNSKFVENILLQEDGNAILDENGNAILLE